MRRLQLTEAQITALLDPPTEQREQVRHYTLTAADRAAIRRCRGDHNRPDTPLCVSSDIASDGILIVVDEFDQIDNPEGFASFLKALATNAISLTTFLKITSSMWELIGKSLASSPVC